ncbi:MAG: DUF2007 domain-containing protein [Leptospirales bacterium]
MSDFSEIYKTNDSFEANIIKTKLADAGINVHLEGENRNALGVLPFDDAAIRIYVWNENFERAKEILHEMDGVTPNDIDINHENQESLEDDNSSKSIAQNRQTAPGFTMKTLIITLMVGAFMGTALYSLNPFGLFPVGGPLDFSSYGHSNESTTSNDFYIFNWNDSTRCETTYWKEDESLDTINCDHNENEYFEVFTGYSRDGEFYTKFYDNNENGIFEKVIDYNIKDEKLFQYTINDFTGNLDESVEYYSENNTMEMLFDQKTGKTKTIIVKNGDNIIQQFDIDLKTGVLKKH